MYNKPCVYFITFTTYGTRLHGDGRGSVVKKINTTELIEENNAFNNFASGLMKQPAVNFDKDQRRIVFHTILKHCDIKKWQLFAIHVRSNHVHVLIEANQKPEMIMNELKAWCTRKLREHGHKLEKVWTKHGSTQYVFSRSKLEEKIRYVILEQGDMMEYYVNPECERFLR